MSDTPALSPCPFCGGDRQFEDFVTNTGGNIRFMRCQDCSAHGPWSTKNHSAQEKWNLRTLNAAPQLATKDMVEAGEDAHYRGYRNKDVDAWSIWAEMHHAFRYPNAAPQGNANVETKGRCAPPSVPAVAAPGGRCQCGLVPQDMCNDGDSQWAKCPRLWPDD